MQWLLYALAFAGGVLLTVQVGVNSTLRVSVGSPAMAALASFVVGLAGLALFLLASGASLPGRAALAAAPLWAWSGGLLGAYYVAVSIFVGPRLGAAALLAISVFGQLLTSLIVDHYGLIGFAQHPLTWARVAGAVLLLAGVLLIVR
jgi:bacterial/archaeal transporter family-2 protein